MNIKVSNLKFSYGNHKVLDNINFEISEGNLLFLMGANGVGKTTLFKCILGHNKKFEGEIFINDNNIKSLSAKKLSTILAYIPQAKSQNFSFSVLDTVLMGTSHMVSTFKTPGKKEIEIAFRALKEVGIIHLKDKLFSQISGGEQQLVLIARALAQKTKILLMDEPTSALDFGNQYKIIKKIKELTNKGYLIIISSHSPDNALQFADKILALDNKTVYAFGDTNQVFDEKLIKKLYDIDVDIVSKNNRKIMYIS